MDEAGLPPVGLFDLPPWEAAGFAAAPVTTPVSVPNVGSVQAAIQDPTRILLAFSIPFSGVGVQGCTCLPSIGPPPTNQGFQVSNTLPLIITYYYYGTLVQSEWWAVAGNQAVTLTVTTITLRDWPRLREDRLETMNRAMRYSPPRVRPTTAPGVNGQQGIVSWFHRRIHDLKRRFKGGKDLP